MVPHDLFCVFYDTTTYKTYLCSYMKAVQTMDDYPQQIEETRDLRREWINMVANRGFKREVNGHQIRVRIEF